MDPMLAPRQIALEPRREHIATPDSHAQDARAG
jgi:hypothetical protein